MQLTFGDAEGQGQRKRTRREIFLTEMEQVVPWKALLTLIEPHYPKMGRPGRQPYSAGDDAAHPLPAAVICVERPGDGRSLVRHACDAAVCRVGRAGRHP